MVEKRPAQSLDAVEAKQKIVYYINKDNKYISTPIYPMLSDVHIQLQNRHRSR